MGRVGAVVLDPEPAGDAEFGGEPVGAHQRRQAGVERDARGRVLADRQQAGVPPDVVRPRLDLLAGDAGQDLLVVRDFERAEALRAGVHRDQRERCAAVATSQVRGG
jgi:hypothetical protein